MVGRARVELATSRLSGVRSNHLSYRPTRQARTSHKGRGRREPAQANRSGCRIEPRLRGRDAGVPRDDIQ